MFIFIKREKKRKMSGFTLFGGISLSTPTGTSVVKVVQPQEVKGGDDEEVIVSAGEDTINAGQETQSTKHKRDKREGKTAFERILPKRVSYGKKQIKRNIRSCCIDGELIKKIAVSAPPYVKFGNRGVEVGEEGNEAPPPAKKAKIANTIGGNNNANKPNANANANAGPKTQPVLTKFNIISEEEKLEAEMRKKEKAHAKNKRRRAAKQAAKRLAQQQQQQQQQGENDKENKDK